MLLAIDARIAKPLTSGIARPLRPILETWSRPSSGVRLRIYVPWKSDVDGIRLGAAAELVELQTRNRLRWYSQLRQRLRDDHVDHAFFPTFSTPLQSIPYTVVVHDLNFLRYSNSPLGLRDVAYRFLTPSIVRRAQNVIVPSTATLQDAQTFYGEGSFHLIPPSMGFPEFRLMDRSEVRDVLGPLFNRGFADDFILHAGRVAPRFKNLRRLMMAFLLAHGRAGVPAQLVIATRDRLPHGCENLFRRHPSAFKLVSNPTDLQLAALYNACLAFVYPSLAEGFGSPILEAMNCGAPILTSNLSAMPETAGSAGSLFNPHDVNSIASTISQVCANPDERLAMKARSLQRAHELGTNRYATDVLSVILTSVGQTAHAKGG